MPGFYQVRHGHDGRKQMAYITSNSYAANWWKATFDQQYPGPSGGITRGFPTMKIIARTRRGMDAFRRYLAF